MINNQELINLARQARNKAFAPISNFTVGSALLTKSGTVYLGCNIEDPSGIGLTNICAKRCAFIKAISDEEKDFVAIAVVGGFKNEEKAMPCGICRQYMMNFNPQLKIITMENNSVKESILQNLLPHAFALDLNQKGAVK